MNAYYCVRKSRLRDDEYVAWASTSPLSGEHPTAERAEPLWFNFGADERELVDALKAEISVLFPRTELTWVAVPVKGE